MKKFSNLIYFLILAVLVFSLSGCMSHTPRQYGNSNSNNDSSGGGGSSGGDSSTTTDLTITTGTRGDWPEQVTTITLSPVSTSSSSVNLADDGIEVYDCVWNVTPEAGEYWTYNGISYDDEQDVQDAMGIEENDTGVYIAYDVRYVPDTLEFSSKTVAKESGGQDQCYVSYYSESLAGSSNYILAALPADNSSNLTTLKASMTHSASEARKNPVLHITKKGIYALSGTWNGQIWVDIPDETTTSGTDTEDDEDAQVLLILDGLTVNCTVAPALVFKNVYQCASDMDSSSEVSALMANDAFSVGKKLADDDEYNAGAVVLLASGKTNTFTGTNVARLNKLKLNDDDYSESDIGNYVKAQKKLYKLDAAFHSRQSIVIGDESSSGSGTLTINSDYEGLGSELHLLIEGGKVNITATDDGINVNEDDVSVFTQTDGTLTITSTNGDGIDSNGYVSLKSCALIITAGSQAVNSAGEAGIDAERTVTGVDSSGNASSGSGVTYTWTASSSSGGNAPGGQNPPDGGNGGTPPNMPNMSEETPPEPPSEN